MMTTLRIAMLSEVDRRLAEVHEVQRDAARLEIKLLDAKSILERARQ